MFRIRFPIALLSQLGVYPPRVTPAQTDATDQAQMDAHDIALVKTAHASIGSGSMGNGSKAPVLEEPGMRLVYEAWLEDQKDATRYEDVQVLQVQIQQEESESDTPTLRKATAYIRIKSYTLPEQILESETVQQEWYKSSSGWWITWDPPTD